MAIWEKAIPSRRGSPLFGLSGRSVLSISTDCRLISLAAISHRFRRAQSPSSSVQRHAIPFSVFSDL